MEVSYSSSHTYVLLEDEMIETNGGFVCRAFDEDLGRYLCVKAVDTDDPKCAMEEVKTLSRFSSELTSLPQIFDTHYDKKQKRLYIFMQWISGDTLTKHMSDSDRDFIGYMIQLCGILAQMAKKKYYHKDIKPDNIIIKKQKLFLIDFNITGSLSNMIEGTPGYRSPEADGQCRYMMRDKADMFAIGVMLYEHYAGKRPAQGKDYARSSRRITVWDYFIDPCKEDTKSGRRMNSIIRKCMAFRPEERYRNYQELINELKGALR
jgi:Serine/threonine protein kinase